MAIPRDLLSSSVQHSCILCGCRRTPAPSWRTVICISNEIYFGFCSEVVFDIPFGVSIADRIAQMTVKMYFEPLVEPYFHQDSYGYRPNKSALDAVAITRQRCWRYDWVLEFDIKGLFDNIDHELLNESCIQTHRLQMDNHVY